MLRLGLAIVTFKISYDFIPIHCVCPLINWLILLLMVLAQNAKTSRSLMETWVASTDGGISRYDPNQETHKAEK